MISDYLVGKMMGLLKNDDSDDSEKWLYIYIYIDNILIILYWQWYIYIYGDWAAIKTDVYSDI